MPPVVAPPAQAVELPPHYYRNNFLRLLDTVEAQYADVLGPEEQGFIDTFRRLAFDTQCLYIRLVSRVGPWFRESRLAYPELGSLGQALDELLGSGMALLAGAIELAEIDRLFTRAELAAALDGTTVGSKAAVLATIEEDDWNERLPQLEEGRILTPAGADTVALLQVLFFGNRYQGLTDFVLSDLGVARYYPYPLDSAHRFFPHRAALDEYMGLALLGDHYRELEEAGLTEEIPGFAEGLLGLEPAYDTSRRRWDRLCNRLARQLERMGGDALALQLYQQSGAHPARERRARLLEKTGDWPAAIAMCREITDSPWCEEEMEAAGRIRPRVQRKLDGGKHPRRRDAFPRTDLRIGRGEKSVELLVAEHLANSWDSVHYVENSLMNALFGLAFWELIFAPVAGAFHNAYQSVPGDMYEAGFAERRQSLIDRRLEALGAADLGKELPAAYRRYRGYQCHWVNWRTIDETLVAAASGIIPREHLLAIWEPMLFDPRENRRGFPDLLALGSTPGDYRLIEVKGPGDALQDSQKRWLRRFQSHGVPAEVAWVSWLDE